MVCSVSPFYQGEDFTQRMNWWQSSIRETFQIITWKSEYAIIKYNTVVAVPVISSLHLYAMYCC